MTKTASVLLVDDHQLMREGLRAILQGHPHMHVVGEAADGHDAIALALATRPDVIIMDVTMRGLNGIDATRRIVAELPGVKVIGLSMHTDRRSVLSMLSAGASGYLLKDAAAEELLRAIEVVLEGKTYLSPTISGLVVDTALHAALPAEASALSGREREVLQLLAEGLTSRDIGAKLHIAVTTVETHRRQIMDKLKLRTIAELTKYAVREGLTSLSS
jgi:DNA-binding NarL/FixJ family response regulator